MFRRRILMMVLLVFLIVGLFALAGGGLYRLGWSQGYAMGSLAGGGEEGRVLVPYAPYGPGFFSPFLFGVGLFFKLAFFFLLFVLFFLVIGKVFRFLIWRSGGGPPARHWRRHPGPTPPWHWGWEGPFEENAEPDAETGGRASGPIRQA